MSSKETLQTILGRISKLEAEIRMLKKQVRQCDDKNQTSSSAKYMINKPNSENHLFSENKIQEKK